MSKNTNRKNKLSHLVKINWNTPIFLRFSLNRLWTSFNWIPHLRTRRNEGLYQVFQENFPISDTRNNFVLRIP
jgi:DNA-directed RNA polymerase subunit beta